MQTETTRRAFCAGTIAATAAAALSAPHAIASPDSADTCLIGLCRAHIDLEQVIADLWVEHVEAYNRTIAAIGECPQSGDRNHVWWERYRHSEAWQTETEHDDASYRQCRLMDEIVRTSAGTLLGIAAKLDLWRRTDLIFIGGNDVLWESIADDLEALTGFRIAEAVDSQVRS